MTFIIAAWWVGIFFAFYANHLYKSDDPDVKITAPIAALLAFIFAGGSITTFILRGIYHFTLWWYNNVP